MKVSEAYVGVVLFVSVSFFAPVMLESNKAVTNPNLSKFLLMYSLTFL